MAFPLSPLLFIDAHALTFLRVFVASICIIMHAMHVNMCIRECVCMFQCDCIKQIMSLKQRELSSVPRRIILSENMVQAKLTNIAVCLLSALISLRCHPYFTDSALLHRSSSSYITSDCIVSARGWRWVGGLDSIYGVCRCKS